MEPELHTYLFMLGDFTSIINFLDKKGETFRSFSLKLWLHTLQSIVRPELKNEIIKLWELILNSKKYWNENLEIIFKEDIKQGIEKEFVETTLKLSKDILKCLPPKEIYS
jgi:hypothetical protein